MSFDDNEMRYGELYIAKYVIEITIHGIVWLLAKHLKGIREKLWISFERI